jgi:hypothetical protein
VSLRFQKCRFNNQFKLVTTTHPDHKTVITFDVECEKLIMKELKTEEYYQRTKLQLVRDEEPNCLLLWKRKIEKLFFGDDLAKHLKLK